MNQKLLKNAVSFVQQSKWTKALPIYENLIKNDPVNIELLNQVSIVYSQVGDYSKAYECMEKILDRKTDDSDFISNFSVICLRLNLIDKAQYLINFAIKIEPTNISYILNLAGIYNIKEEYLKSLETIKLALKVNPLHGGAYGLFGITLIKMGENSAARDAFEIALKIDPLFLEAKFNLASLEVKEGNVEKAIELYENLILIRTDEINSLSLEAIKFNLSSLYLWTGKLKLGWDYAEFGFHPQVPPEYRRKPGRNFKAKRWNGLIAKDKTILVWREQGVGDEIIYLSCLPDLIDTGMQVIVETDERLIPLLKRSFPDCLFRVQNFDMNSHDKKPHNEDYDYQIPVGSLPSIFRKTIHCFNDKKPYIITNHLLRSEYKQKLKNISLNKLKIGICWRSGYLNPERSVGYTKLSDWGPIFNIKNVDFINLQYSECEHELMEAESLFDIKVIRWQELDLKNDFDSTGALIANLDLVVTVATAVSPLAASIGIPVFLMGTPDWANLGTNYFPWFNNITCFFPKTKGEVCSCIPEVAESIEQIKLKNKVTTL
jgi:tetratricopeptide (TPR) repeat protein